MPDSDKRSKDPRELILDDNFRRIFSNIVSSRKTDPRIYLTGIYLAWSAEDGKEYKKPFDKYRRGKRRPSPSTAWRLGNTLHDKFNVPWMSGLWMLYAAGHFADYLGTIITWLYASEPTSLTTGIREDIWNMLTTAQHIGGASHYPDDPRIAEMFLFKSYNPAKCWRIVQQVYEERDATLTEKSQKRILNDVSREVAKEAWRSYSNYRKELDDAFTEWTKTKSQTNWAALPKLVYTVASGPLDIEDRESTALIVLYQWFFVDRGLQDSVGVYPTNPKFDWSRWLPEIMRVEGTTDDAKEPTSNESSLNVESPWWIDAESESERSDAEY